MLSLRQLHQFLAVAETMSFRRAAERLNMAQPPLTAAIRQMEAEIGVRLFERTNRVTDLTAAGAVLREEAFRVVAQMERAIALTRRAGSGASGSLRIGFVASAVRHLLPALIAEYRAAHPAVMVELEEAPTARQVAALLDNRIDVGIVALPLPPGSEARLAVKVLVQSQLVVAIPSRHVEAATNSPIALAKLADEPWILFPAREGPGLHATILRACAAIGFTPQVAQRAVQMETIIGLVATGLGVALVPRLFSESAYQGVVFRELTGYGSPIPYEIALAWRMDDDMLALRTFIESSINSSKSSSPNA